MGDTEHDLDFELTDELASFITDLHASEINGEISWFYDNVWGAKLGDKLNGYVAEATELPSLGHAARWLCDRALDFYPDSEFAKEYLRARPDYKPLTQADNPPSEIGDAISTGVVPTTDALAGPPTTAQSQTGSMKQS